MISPTHGNRYDAVSKPKSELYLELLPMINSGQVELLDHPRLFAQLCRLEAEDSAWRPYTIYHAPGAHDDLANAAAGALVTATSDRLPTPEVITSGTSLAKLARAW